MMFVLRLIELLTVIVPGMLLLLILLVLSTRLTNEEPLIVTVNVDNEILFSWLASDWYQLNVTFP